MKPGERARSDLVAELGDLRQPRGAVDRAVHQHRPGRPRRLRVEVVSDDDIGNSLSGKGIRQTGRWSPGGEQPLHRIQRADRLRRCERDRVAHTPRAAAEHLKRFVVAGSPHLRGERSTGRNEHPPGGEPELCSSSQSAVSCQYGGIASNAPGGVSRPVHASDVPVASATSTTMPTATRLSFSGWAKARTHSPPRHASRQRNAAQQVREAEHQRQPDQRLQLVHVAQRGSVASRNV